ncbi:hypothetical protein A5714_11085 [Mycobacterium sp. E2462]|nr:hypothetical protein A5714_11085 [Mycobacterium sp. E2462]
MLFVLRETASRQIGLRRDDDFVEQPQLMVQRFDLRFPALLCFGQSSGNVFQMGTDHRQLQRLCAKGFGHPLHFG